MLSELYSESVEKEGQAKRELADCEQDRSVLRTGIEGLNAIVAGLRSEVDELREAAKATANELKEQKNHIQRQQNHLSEQNSLISSLSEKVRQDAIYNQQIAIRNLVTRGREHILLFHPKSPETPFNTYLSKIPSSVLTQIGLNERQRSALNLLRMGPKTLSNTASALVYNIPLSVVAEAIATKEGILRERLETLYSMVAREDMDVFAGLLEEGL
ncbi:hypothetical protein HK097_007195 [Rhizophlyctis rosea]|uniref:Uncharacterized protein n=1 Tax=Rhizophlyctis rosea TaxID=64517 RepID=A0AAD5SIT8_9FUNG|nr:hypothetical protein HK097_007195 [Rhizophlyctis rosea]